MKITLRSQRVGLVTKEGSAKTLKDVKALFADSNIDFSNVEFVDRATKAGYKLDDSKIPNVEEILFLLVPVKNKSGVDITTISLDEVNDMGYNQIRSLGSKLNKENGASLSLNGSTNDIKNVVVSYLMSNTPTNESSEDLYEDAKSQICAIIDNLKDKNEPQIVETVVNTIMGLTEEDIASEHDSIIESYS